MYVKIHKHLDRKIWDKNEYMYPIVSDMLKYISWAFVDYIRNEYSLDIKNSDIKDIIVFGSITQLFFDKQSNIDVCIVMDLTNVQKQFPNSDIGKMLKLYYYDWAMTHLCKIYGRKIDLNLEDAQNNKFNGRYRTGPNYSLLQNQWTFKPRPVSKQEMKKILKDADDIYNRILQDFKTVKKNGFNLDEIDTLYGNIVASRKNIMNNTPDQIASPMYFAHRAIKHHGFINTLRKHAVKKATQEFVLK